MLFALTKASNSKHRQEIEVSSLEELVNLVDEYGDDIIVSKNPIISRAKYRLIIYDDYLE